MWVVCYFGHLVAWDCPWSVGWGVVLGWAAWWVVLGGVLGSRFLVLGTSVLYMVVWCV